MLDRSALENIVRRANLAPSVHNTQPARWRFEADGTVSIFADKSRFLTVGDLQGRDAALSCGAAVEGTVMALADMGLETVSIEELWQTDTGQTGLKPVARLVPRDGGKADPLSPCIERRATWRGGFEPIPSSTSTALREWAIQRDDIALATAKADLEMLASLNDDVSLRFYRREPYRLELVHWMRLTSTHPDYARDGLNLEALRLNRLEAQAARLGLATPLFGVLDALGIAKLMLGERNRTLTSAAVVLFHRPRSETPFSTGRAFYRLWLELTHLGLSAWPMAALADDPEAAAECCSRFGIGEDRRLINLLRVGRATGGTSRSRLSAPELIIAWD